MSLSSPSQTPFSLDHDPRPATLRAQDKLCEPGGTHCYVDRFLYSSEHQLTPPPRSEACPASYTSTSATTPLEEVGGPLGPRSPRPASEPQVGEVPRSGR